MAIVLLFAGGFIFYIAGSSLQGAFLYSRLKQEDESKAKGKCANCVSPLLWGNTSFPEDASCDTLFSPFARTHLSSLAAEESGSVSVSVWVLDLL